jgi:threonine synthase
VAEGTVGRRASAVAVITGNGLKDVRSASAAVGAPFDISPDGAELPNILQAKDLIVGEAS